MKKLIILFLPLLLLGGISQAQEPAVMDTPTAQTRRASKFQGLWQQRKGHNLRLEYGFQADLLGNTWVDKYTPLRFDLEYQYDIPWNPKRINFYAYAGIVYKQLDVSYTDDMNYFYDLCLKGEDGYGGYIGIGLKIHCTDWLHVSFAQAFNVMQKYVLATVPDDYEYLWSQTLFWPTLIGSQTSIRIVGQIKQWSIYLGYRVDHWQKKIMDYGSSLFFYDNMFPMNGFYDNYLTFGIGYDF